MAVSILELSKIVMCESWFDYERLKYREKAKLCYMDTDDFIKTDYIYKDIAEEVETRFDIWTDHYHKEKIKKVIGLMKDELGWIIIAKLVRLRAKSYSYLLDDGSEDKKSKCTKKYVIKKT